MKLRDLVLQNRVKTVISSGLLINCSKELYSKSVVYEKLPGRLFNVYEFSSADGESSESEHGTLRHSINAEKFRGQGISLSAALRTESADAAALWVCLIDRQKQNFDYHPSEMLFGSYDWTRAEIIVEVPESTTTINYGIRLRSGTMWSTEPILAVVDH